MTSCNVPFALLMPAFRICLLVLVTFSGPCDGVTLFVNSKYPPPPPFVTSLYRAPQTYDRGKSSMVPRPFIIISKVRPCHGLESARHFGLVKQGSLPRPQQEHRLTTPSNPSGSVWTLAETNQLMSSAWSATKAPQTQDFRGNWQIIQPVVKEDLDDRVIKYNKDGTRVVHETLYNYHTRDVQIAIKDVKGSPQKEVKGHEDEPSNTASPSPVPYPESASMSVTQTAMVPATPPKVKLIAHYHIVSVTTQTRNPSTGSYISTTPALATTAPKSTTSTEAKQTHTLGPIAVASSYFVHDSSKIPAEPKKPVIPSTQAPLPTVTPYMGQDLPASPTPSKSLISKLSGGAESIFNQIFGGLLNGRHTEDKSGDALSHGSGTEASPAWTKPETEAAFQGTNQRNESLHPSFAEHITKKLPNSFWNQLKFLQEQLEKSNPKGDESTPTTKITNQVTRPVPALPTFIAPTTASNVDEPASTLFSQDEHGEQSTSVYDFDFSSTPYDTWPPEHSPHDDQHQELTTPTQFSTDNSTGEEEYTDFSHWVTGDELAKDMSDAPISMSTPSSMLFGKMNSPASCSDCADVTKREKHGNSGLTTSTSGWRPLRRPVPFRPEPSRAPAPAPLSIHQWLHSSWNDTSDWWTIENEQVKSSTDFEPENTTEKAVRKWFQKVSASKSIPRLPSQTPQKLDVTTYRPLLGLSPIHWLFGSNSPAANDSENATNDMVLHDSQDVDTETMVKEGQEIFDVPTSRVKPPQPDSKPSAARRESSSAQLLKHAQIVNQSNSINASHVSRETRFKSNHSQYRLAPEKHGQAEKPAENSTTKNADQTFSPAEVIKEMGKFYTKLKVGLGLPLPLDIIEPLITMKYESMKAQDRLNDADLQKKLETSAAVAPNMNT